MGPLYWLVSDLLCLLDNPSAFLMALTTSRLDFLLSVCGRGGGGGLTCDWVLRYHGGMMGRGEDGPQMPWFPHL